MISIARLIGAFVRWLWKGCKTDFADERFGQLKATWGFDYNFENYVIGIITCVAILGIIILIFFTV